MSLQRAKELITEAGRLVAEEGINSPEYGEFLFEAVAGLLIAKKAIRRTIEEQDARREATEFGRFVDGLTAVNPADCGTVSVERGVDGGDTGKVHVPGETQAHAQEPPQ